MILIVGNILLLLSIFLMKTKGYIESILKTLLTIGCLTLLYAEVSSVFSGLTPSTCKFFWIATLLGLIFVIIKQKLRFNLPMIDINELKKNPIFIVIIAFALMIFGATLFAAIHYPPNTSDSMVYHMPRIMHWIQNHSVMHYPTNSIRQVYMGPFAEFVILNLQLLAKSDIYANLVQWISFLGCCFGVFGIVGLLGGDIRAQFFAFIACATLPMAILQSTGTQTDLIASLCLVSLTYFILKYRTERTIQNLLFIGISLGLGVLTKGTMYVFALPFMTWWLTELICTKDKKLIIKSCLTMFLVVVLINIGHWGRNFSLFGTIFVPKSHAIFYKNETIAPNYLLSALIKNTTLNLGIANPTATKGIKSFVERVDKLLQVEKNSPLITFPKQRFSISYNADNELDTGNVLHFLLILIGIGMVPFLKPLKANRPLLIFIACSLTGFVLFGVLLKWQPWGARLQLPFFVIMSGFLGFILANENLKPFFNFIALLFFIFSLNPLLYNKLRPVLILNAYNYSRFEHLFNNRINKFEQYIGIMHFIQKSGCRDILLISEDDTYEYPIWSGFGGKIRIQHAEVTNETKVLESKKPFSEFKYCRVIKIDDSKQ